MSRSMTPDRSAFPLVANTLFVAGLLLSATGCTMSHYSGENLFTPSPDGKSVASAFGSGWRRNVWDDSVDLSAASELRIRTGDGKSVETHKWASGKSSVDTGIQRLAWNPSGSKLAVLWTWSGALDVVDVPVAGRKHLLAGVRSFCWLNDSNLLCVVVDSDHVVSVLRFGLNGEAPAPIFSLRCVPGTAPENCLSPDGRALVLWKGREAAMVDLANTNKYAPWVVPVSFIYDGQCFWSSDGARCLVHAGAEAPKSDQPESRSKAALLFYDRTTGNLVDLADRLLTQASASNLMFSGELGPSAKGQVWGGNGDWFVVTTLPAGYYPDVKQFKDWVCMISPWAAISIKDKLGNEFWSPKPFPKGNRLALIRVAHPDDGENGIYVTEVVTDAFGQVSLSPARCVARNSEYHLANWGIESWWWSGDGQAIITFDGKEFHAHAVAPRGQSNRPVD
jgi:hypothetical protein